MNNFNGNILTSLLSSDAPELVFSSNFTPDIKINLLEIVKLKDKPTPPPATKVVEEGGTALKLIRPEIIIEGLGFKQSFAPYGKPYANMFMILAGGVLAAGLISGLIAWHICRNKIVSTKHKALITKLRTELGPEVVKKLKQDVKSIKKLTES